MFDIVWSPSGGILKETNASNMSVVAKVEPMLHATRDVDHVSAFDGHTKNRSAFRVQMKDSFARDCESDFVLAVRMLLVKLLKHRVQIRRVGMDIDHVRSDEATLFLDLLDLWSIFRQDILIGRGGLKPPRNLPLFEPNPKRLQKFGNFDWIVNRSLLRWNEYACHDFFGIK